MREADGARPMRCEAPARTMAALVAIALAMGLAGCAGQQAEPGGAPEGQQAAGASSEEPDLTFSKRDLDPSYDAASATQVVLADEGIEVTGAGAEAEGSTLTISAAGTYVVSGSLSDGRIVVAAGDEDKLQVVLDGASVHSEDGPALSVDNADKVFVTLPAGTESALSDGASYALAGEDDNRDAALFSRDDLTVNGTGTLAVTSSFAHAIVSKDDLVIAGPTLVVSAKEDAFQGKDAIKVASGTLTVDAGDDAFHSETLLYVQDGSIDVRSCYEGYEAEKVIIDGGTHAIVASDDALNAAAADAEDTASEAQDGMSAGAGPAGQPQQPDGAFDASQEPPDGMTPAARDQDGEGAPPASGGEWDGAEAPPAPGDGGRGGAGVSERGAAGAEEPPDLPAGSQADGQGAPDAFGGEPMAQSSSACLIEINGGTLMLSGGNDGIDSNGSIEINGGTILVCGPDAGMDGALDYDLSAQVNGGIVLMTGAVASTRGLDLSAQAWTIASVAGGEGSTVSLQDASGAELASLVATMPFTSAFVSAPDLAEGDAFAIVVDGVETSLAMEAAGASSR